MFNPGKTHMGEKPDNPFLIELIQQERHKIQEKLTSMMTTLVILQEANSTIHKIQSKVYNHGL